MPCKASRGVNNNACGDLLAVGGVSQDFYVAYLSDFSTRPSLTQTGPISSLSFTAYNGLVKFNGNKFWHNGTWPAILGAGGNTFYQHTFTAKLLPLNTADDVEVQRLQQAQDAVIIVPTNNNDILIFGAGNGLRGMASPGGNSTGTNAEDDITDQVLLQGAERTKPLRFDSGTGFATSIAYLEARVI